MKFWDSSAVVSILVEELPSGVVRGLLREDPAVVVWWATRTECVSALTRRKMAERGMDQTMDKLRKFMEDADEVEPHERVRQEAEVILRRHQLTAADAFQLASALAWAENNPSGKGFVCLDAKLRGAARKEGFEVFPAL